METVDSAMGWVNGKIAAVMFWDVWFWDNGHVDENGASDEHTVPLAVLWLILGAVYFTFRMGFINLRGFGHALRVTKGDYDNPDDEGEVSHFQALASALSATVGLGNIAGVAIAISVGGPGATFWMIAAGFLGMSSKFVECTLGQKFRQVRPDGRVMGGAMYYLSNGLGQMGLGGLGKVLAMLFAILCIGGSFGGGNTFQVNQSLNAIQEVDGLTFLADHRWIYGAVMTVMVGIVILGGIKRIAATAEKIVPLMCGIYVLACFYVLTTNFDHIGRAFSEIFEGAFAPSAAYGGIIGVLVQGFKRAAFSNEAGVGSAAIAHSAAKTEYPVREGIVALLEPFIDTIVVCTMTALVIVITGAYDGKANPEYLPYLESANGAGLTSMAFRETISWFPMVLGVAVALFAFSTMISWSYYGERCWAYVFGDGSSTVYRILFLVFTFLGSIITAQNVLDFGDLMILGMAFPNVLGVLLLSGGVKRDLDSYWQKLQAGEFKTYT
ncbi:MAG: alanine:cation symporter family protein [Planctomycetes bacterium]|nr:alanine:cation symporter family protein [Planctomycetota bacterium]